MSIFKRIQVYQQTENAPSEGYKLSIKIDPHLPIEEGYPAYDLDLKCEVLALTGKKIHSQKMGNTIYVSKELYQHIKNTYWP